MTLVHIASPEQSGQSGPTLEVTRVRLPGSSFDALRVTHAARLFPAHFHDSYAVGIVDSGACRLITRGNSWVARPGSLVRFSPGQVHVAEVVSQEPYGYSMIYLTADLIREFGVDCLPGGPGTPDGFGAPVLNDPGTAHLFRRTHTALLLGSASAAIEADLVSSVRRMALMGPYSRMRVGDENPSHLRVVEQARSLLGIDLSRPLLLSSVAEACRVSPFHLIRVFTRLVGISPYEYRMLLRLNWARASLRAGSTVSQVAHACGYSDQSHLTRVFKRMIGLPPGRYCAAIRELAA